MKKLVKILVIAVVAILVLGIAKDMIIKASVEKGVQIVTGLKLNMSSLKVGIVNTMVGIKDMRLFNPAGYKDPVMLNMPEVYVDYNLPDIIGGKIHLNEVRINMKEFVVVKNEKGELNLDSLRVVQAEKEGKSPAAKTEKKGEGKAPEIQIDSLILKIGKVSYKDYSKGGKPSIKEFEINLDEKYENITDPYSIVSLIVVKALMNTSIASLTGFDLGGLQGTVGDTLASAQKLTGEAAAKAQETLQQTQAEAAKKLAQTRAKAEAVAKESAERLKKAAEGLTDKIKLPFGQ